jgi:hypothetical protein
MAGKIIADTIEASGSQISLNVGNVTILTASSTGLTLTPTSNVNINITSGSASFGAGNVSFPSIAASGDLNTGIFFSAADTIDFAEGGTATGQFDSSGNFKFNSGYGSVATAYGCRAWVNFNGTGTVAIRASGNVSSITDLATGTYTVNLTTAIVDANYAIQISSGFASGIREDVFGVLYNDAPYTPTTTAYTIKFYRADTNVAADSNYSMTSIFR